MRTNCRRHGDQSLMEPVRECRKYGYLLSSKKLGSGSFSKVYLGYASNEKLLQNYKLASDLWGKQHSKVAIKIIATNQAPAEYHRKFLPREVYALNTTYKHMNVIQLYEYFKNERRSYLVLELASKGDLLEYINVISHRRIYPGLDETDARRLFRQIVSAVTHCHSHGIVHRDLKCENILLDERGHVKLTDFGFASQYNLRHSLMSTFCGSVAYTAPEILMTKKYNGAMSDLWSLGVILFAMVTGKLPFKERQPYKMLRLIKQGLIFQTPVSKECKDLIRSLLQWKPSSRLKLDQITTHCWMLPYTPINYHKRLLSVGNLVLQRSSEEQKQKKGKMSPRLLPSPKSSSPQLTIDSSTTRVHPKPIAWASCTHLRPTGRISEPKMLTPCRQCRARLLYQPKKEERQCKTTPQTTRIVLQHSVPATSLPPPQSLPRLPRQSLPYLSISHSNIKMDKTPLQLPNSEHSEPTISLSPIADLSKRPTTPWSMDMETSRLTFWLSRPNS